MALSTGDRLPLATVPAFERPTAVRWDAALAARSALSPRVTAPFCARVLRVLRMEGSALSFAASLALEPFNELRLPRVPP